MAAFAELLKAIDWEVVDVETARSQIQRGLTSTGWSLRSLSLNRYRTNAGMAPSGAGRVTTADGCVHVADVIASLGPPPSLTLAPPLGSLDISTPELVRKYLQAGKVISVQYAFKPALSYWFDFDTETGCFDTFYIQRR